MERHESEALRLSLVLLSDRSEFLLQHDESRTRKICLVREIHLGRERERERERERRGGGGREGMGERERG